MMNTTLMVNNRSIKYTLSLRFHNTVSVAFGHISVYQEQEIFEIQEPFFIKTSQT